MTGGGVPRPVKMAKYLRHLGWDVTVLTVHGAGPVDPRLSVDGVATVLRVREWRLGWLLKVVGGTVRVLRLASERFARRGETGRTSLDRGFAYEEREIESSKIGWVLPALRAALRAHRTSPIDVAVVSLPPAASGTVGWLLNRLRGIPYVVEYRDPWTVGAFWTSDADGRPRSDVATRARYRLTRRLEATLLQASAGAIIVNGEAHVDRLAAAFPRQTAGKPIAHIRNGVDIEDTAPERGSDATTPVLRLLHTGFFYHFYTPHQLISALRLVLSRRSEALDGIELEFMGSGFPEHLVQELDGWGLSHLVRLTAAGSYSDALAATRRADGLFAVLPALDSDRDRLPTKVYEYLGTDRPILIVADPAGAASNLVAGLPDVLIADNRSQEAIADAFASFVQLARRRRADGCPAENGKRGEPHHYLQRAAEMDRFLHQVLNHRNVSAGS
ncbi:glycosyltransferase [Micromonospora sp. WMMD1082]|uniref:glycosyltransferase n=1 Tax=Micromonospora sp. WMMD1082 TaxID=3016104 RepID=UPI0024163854|nr:glycosyltransferase [Micromonospora sp. WMMD1082]MDG4793691.1 glycosyltransferase [Micromonospora sp. WMMD1082]